MSPEGIMLGWRPGSYDEPWSWKDERKAIWKEHSTQDLLIDIRDNGIREPVILGDDGRVWEGHHRICIAWWLSLSEIPYELGVSDG